MDYSPIVTANHKTLEEKIYNRKESEKKYLYRNHFVVHMKLAQYCKSIIVQ